MDEIVVGLRNMCDWCTPCPACTSVMLQAANKIEELDKDLRNRVGIVNAKVAEDTKFNRGWYVTDISGMYYLHKNGSWKLGVQDDAFWPTEKKADEARTRNLQDRLDACSGTRATGSVQGTDWADE